ncbi:hypothetical protein FQA39_LY09096 [Lamprigera yunnana]|nr:hypothetical protein FQA39_LY09096 [Lamprigera yunnana]
MTSAWKSSVCRLRQQELQYELLSRGFDATMSVDALRKSVRSVWHMEAEKSFSATSHSISFTDDQEVIERHIVEFTDVFQCFTGDVTHKDFLRAKSSWTHADNRCRRMQGKTAEEKSPGRDAELREIRSQKIDKAHRPDKDAKAGSKPKWPAPPARKPKEGPEQLDNPQTVARWVNVAISCNGDSNRAAKDLPDGHHTKPPTLHSKSYDRVHVVKKKKLHFIILYNSVKHKIEYSLRKISAQLGRRNKSTTETMAEFLEQKGVLARRLKLDDELHLPQLVDMFGPAVLPYLQASQPMPPTNETREEKIVLPEDITEVNDIGEMDEEAESHANSEGDELVAAAEEVEILGNDADAEVDVVRDINIDPKEDETVEEEIIDEVILDKVASVIVRQHLEPLDHAVPVVLGDLHTQGGKQCPREEVHAQSGTQEASKKNAPRRKGESDALFNRPKHHSTDTKADALRMSDVENGKVRERTRSPPEFLEQKGVLARRLKLDDELHLLQLVDMFGPAVLPYLQASQPMPPTNETREEKIVLPEDITEVNDIGEMDEEAESHANAEGDELAAAAEEVEILGNDADADVDVVRDINIDPEEEETVEEEIVDEVILDKVASVIVRQQLEPLDHAVPVVLGDLHTHGGKQCPREEVHAQSGTQEASKQNAPRRKGESDALFNRPRHHSTDTKADALRMSDVENGKFKLNSYLLEPDEEKNLGMSCLIQLLLRKFLPGNK